MSPEFPGHSFEIGFDSIHSRTERFYKWICGSKSESIADVGVEIEKAQNPISMVAENWITQI
jgi:hypothetical protein